MSRQSQIVQQAHFGLHRRAGDVDARWQYAHSSRRGTLHAQMPSASRNPHGTAMLTESKRSGPARGNARHRKICLFICTRNRQICSYFRNSSGTFLVLRKLTMTCCGANILVNANRSCRPVILKAPSASSLRTPRLETKLNSPSDRRIERRQSTSPRCSRASLSRIEVTSTGVPGLHCESRRGDDEGADAAGFALASLPATAVPEAGARRSGHALKMLEN